MVHCSGGLMENKMKGLGAESGKTTITYMGKKVVRGQREGRVNVRRGRQLVQQSITAGSCVAEERVKEEKQDGRKMD